MGFFDLFGTKRYKLLKKYLYLHRCLTCSGSGAVWRPVKGCGIPQLFSFYDLDAKLFSVGNIDVAFDDVIGGIGFIGPQQVAGDRVGD